LKFGFKECDNLGWGIVPPSRENAPEIFSKNRAQKRTVSELS